MRRGHSRVLLLTTLPTGLITGLFHGFSVAINPALARLPDAEYIETMQAINETIQNPWFGLPFFGGPLLLVGAAWRQHRAPGPSGWRGPRRGSWPPNGGILPGSGPAGTRYARGLAWGV